jgi:predicted transposase YdaD
MREGVLQEEREIILRLDATSEVRADLMAVAFTIGACYFSREVLETVFREELPMIKGTELIQEWVREGEARGAARQARAMLLRLLRARFGDLPERVVGQIEGQDSGWCEELAVKTLGAASLEDLGFHQA